ncbi:MAG TPA: dihydroorotate dehydrogenase (quinone), partial [Candidatus Thermoplasmatota archaeon]|nr:dihydroorotate dehydrogenase (quinone) [Candidatus Thermoplasmatota archaeon]
MYGPLKAALFRMDPEKAHHAALAALRPLHRSPTLQSALRPRPDPRLACSFLGNDVAAPLGVAAGFDKGAEAYNALLALGFAHVEVGTVTPRPQPGNDGVRLQRFPELHALVNRMGFPGPGCGRGVT